VYPYGNDTSTRFGVDPDGTWDYDGRDAAHPPIADPEHDAGFIYDERYYQAYQDAGYGWPPAWDPGRGTPDYPTPGLLKDTRAPISVVGQPEFWQVKAYAPNNPQTETISFIWEVNGDPGFEIPLDGSMYVKVLGNSDLEAAVW
jgi:hypothetical protein